MVNYVVSSEASIMYFDCEAYGFDLWKTFASVNYFKKNACKNIVC